MNLRENQTQDLKLYSYFRSSASYRVRLGLFYKKIPFEYHAVHLLNQGGEQNSSEYQDLNPMRQVPSLVWENKVLTQSMAILEHLDSLKPNPRLFPLDPMERVRAVEICEIVNSGIQPLQNVSVLQALERQFGADLEKKNAWCVGWIEKGFEALDRRLEMVAGKFSLGDTFGVVDCFLVPQIFAGLRYKVVIEAYPSLFRVYKNCLSLDFVRLAHPAAQPDTPAGEYSGFD